jgi:NADH-quinone oxidoreductase subunit L
MFSIAWWIPLLPILSFITIVLFTKKSKLISSGISILVMLTCFIFSIMIFIRFLSLPLSARPINFSVPWMIISSLHLNIGILIDPLSINMIVLVTFISLLVQIYSLGYMKNDPRFSVYFSYLSLFTASMLGLVLSNNYLQLFIFWELVGLCSYLLIGFWYFKPSAATACKKAFVVNRIGDFGFLMGIITLGLTFHAFDFQAVHQKIALGLNNGVGSTAAITLIALLLFCGAVGKSAQFPLHVWLPDAMEGPTPISALIHAATMVAAGVFMIARTYQVFSASTVAMTTVAYVGGFTAIFAATIALTQDDIKRILAYSTLSQLGYMVLALGVGGYTAGMFHLTSHAFFKALLFLGAGSVIHSMETNDIWKMGGLLKKMKVTGITFLIAALSISGIPPFSGFWSKDEIFDAIQSSHVQGHQILLGIAIFTAFLTSLYMFRLFFVVFLGNGHHEEDSHENHAIHESPWTMLVPMIILAFMSIFFGMINAPHLGLYSKFIYYGSHPQKAPFSIKMVLISSLVATSGIILASLFYWQKVFSAKAVANAISPIYTLLKNKYYIDEFYSFLAKYFVFGLAALCAWFDKYVVDGGMVDGSGKLICAFGRGLRKIETGKIQNYALVIFGAIAVIYLIMSF